MTPAEFLGQVLIPGLAWLEQIVGPAPPASREARLLLLAIAGQESEWQNVAQGEGGPGRGPWQFEPETCREIIANTASAALATKVCRALNIVPSRSYISILGNIDLAVAFARLDLWCDAYPLPAYGDEGHAWHYYNTCWRPGKPSQLRWTTVYPAALAADRAWQATQETKV